MKEGLGLESVGDGEVYSLKEDDRYSLIDGFSKVRRGKLDEIAKKISNDRSANPEDKLRVRLKGLTKDERIAVQVAISQESNGTLEDLKKRAETIQNAEPIKIDKTAIDLSALENKLVGKEIIVGDDGMHVSFTSRAVEKLYNKVVSETGVANNIEKLLKNANYAFSQEHNNTGLPRGNGTIYPERPNAIEYRSYVTKFNNGEDSYYCRFVVMRDVDGDNVSHGATVSEIEIKKVSEINSTNQSEGNSSTFGSIGPRDTLTNLHDAKLDNFFNYAIKGEPISNDRTMILPLKVGEVAESGEYSLKDDERRPTFYSNAERAVENVKQEKATAEGVKPAESNAELQKHRDEIVPLDDVVEKKKQK